MQLDLATVDHLLTTTRSVRKRLDLTRPVPLDVVERCLEIAMQAPTGSNRQDWHFVIVTDPARKQVIAECYRRAFAAYATMSAEQPQLQEGDPRYRQTLRIVDSATYLARNLERVPVLVLAAIEGRVEHAAPVFQASVYGSILPAVWSFMLALRARGLGSAWTTLHIMYEREVAAALGIPDAVTQAALVPVAFYTGEDFRPARRLPAATAIHREQWGCHSR